MAPQVLNDFVSLVCAHPVISGMVLILFTPPFFPIVKFFSPLLISTALFMLALFTMGPKSTENETSQGGDGDDEGNWELRRNADEHGDGEKVSKRMKPDGSWKDWVESIEESSLSWMSSPRSSSKHKNENWKHGVLNDDNVSILEETSWVKSADFGEDGSSGSRLVEENMITDSSFMPSLMAPSMLFKVDSGLQDAAQRSIYDDITLGEDAPELEDVAEHVTEPLTEPVVEPEVKPVAEPVAEPVLESDHPSEASVESSAPVPEISQPSGSQGVQHQPLGDLQIPRRADGSETDSPATDLDDSPAVDNSKRLIFANLKKSVLNASPSLSDADTPEAVNLSLSGKLKQMEKLGDFLHDAEHAEEAGQESPKMGLLNPTTAEQVDDVKDHLESFVQEKAASSQTEKSLVATSPAQPDNEAAKGAEEKITSDSTTGNVFLSDSESELEIFPSADPAKMKLHLPVKLDIEQLEKKLDTSLSHRTRATSPPPKDEISEVTHQS